MEIIEDDYSLDEETRQPLLSLKQEYFKSKEL